MTVYDMKNLLRAHNLPTTGTRLELCERIQNQVYRSSRVSFKAKSPSVYRPTSHRAPPVSPAKARIPTPILKPSSPSASQMAPIKPSRGAKSPKRPVSTQRTRSPQRPRSPRGQRSPRALAGQRLPKRPLSAQRIRSPQRAQSPRGQRSPSGRCSPRINYRAYDDVNGLTVYDMKIILQKNGLSPWGTRAELCTRILKNKLSIDVDAPVKFNGYTRRVVRGDPGVNGLTTAEMKAVLRDYGASPWGTRAELAERIVGEGLMSI
jgi:hypothetical protein